MPRTFCSLIQDPSSICNNFWDSLNPTAPLTSVSVPRNMKMAGCTGTHSCSSKSPSERATRRCLTSTVTILTSSPRAIHRRRWNMLKKRVTFLSLDPSWGNLRRRLWTSCPSQQKPENWSWDPFSSGQL